MRRVVSADGTCIGYEHRGAGSPVLLVSGGLDDGSENVPLANALAGQFSVINYARRGRAPSGDTLHYALEREFEDLSALIQAVAEPAYVFGASSGGALALEAAAAGVGGITKIAVYEVPYNMSEEWPAQWRAYVEALTMALDNGNRGDALELFLRLTGASDTDVAAARSSPFWSASEALEHTLAYDAACLGSGQPDAVRLAAVRQPTLVLTRNTHDASDTAAWLDALDDAADAMVAALANGVRGVVVGQAHVPDPAALATTLGTFFRRC
jgi:pimeloyl-ACP methyl ester carboxylesterase